MKKEKGYFANFGADLVPVLAQWTEERWINPRFPGIQIEPSPDGGVDLIANDASALLWIHEPPSNGNARSDGPIFLGLTEELIDACREPKRPRLIDVNCDAPRYSMPGWMRPGRIHVSSLPDRKGLAPEQLVVVGTLEQPPEGIRERFVDSAGLYSASLGRPRRDPTPWRRCFEERTAEVVSTIALQPRYLGRLASVGRLFGPRCQLTFGGPLGGVLVTFRETAAGRTAKAFIMPLEDKVETQP